MKIASKNHSKTSHKRDSNSIGFSLTELMIVLSIMSIMVVMAIPIYSSAMSVAEEATAIEDIKTISQAVDNYFMMNGVLPKTLAQVGFDDRVDPWGKPYIFKPVADAQQLGKKGRAAKRAARKAAKATKKILAAAALQSSTENAIFSTNKKGKILIDVDGDGVIDVKIKNMDLSQVQKIFLMALKLDANDMPVNSDYDLYSLGADGDSDVKIDAELSKDDIIRGRDGNFIDRAEKY